LGFLGLNEPNIRAVLDIAEEIMHSGKTLDVEYLYNISKKKLNISRRILLDIIDFLLGNHVLVEGTRFTRDEILENTYRAQIWKLIETQGGVHFSFIKKHVFFETPDNPGSPGQLLWHLGLLLKFKYIKRCKSRNYTVFMPSTLDEKIGIACFLMNDSVNLNILKLFLQQPSVRKTDVYKDSSEARDTVHYRIKSLIECGFIKVDQANEDELQLQKEKRDVVAKAFQYREEHGE